jgi:hypothetical protein
MNRYVNWNRFLRYFLLFESILLLACVLCGCTAAWLSAVDALLPALAGAVGAIAAFVKSLDGKTLSADFTAKVQQIQQDIATEITNVQTLIADFKNAATGAQGSILTQIQAVFQGILSNLSSILSGAGITDASTTSKLTQLIGLAVAAAQAVIALLPLVASKLQSGEPVAQLEADDRMAAAAVKQTTESLKEAYVIIRTEPTPNPDVNAALEALPPSI